VTKAWPPWIAGPQTPERTEEDKVVNRPCPSKDVLSRKVPGVKKNLEILKDSYVKEFAGAGGNKGRETAIRQVNETRDRKGGELKVKRKGRGKIFNAGTPLV